MKFLKTAFAIFASVLLGGAQAVFALGEKTSSAAQECGCCACKQTDCCVAQSESTPEPIPSAPVRTASQNAFQLIAFVSSLLLPLPENVSLPIAPALFASF